MGRKESQSKTGLLRFDSFYSKSAYLAHWDMTSSTKIMQGWLENLLRTLNGNVLRSVWSHCSVLSKQNKENKCLHLYFENNFPSDKNIYSIYIYISMPTLWTFPGNGFLAFGHVSSWGIWFLPNWFVWLSGLTKHSVLKFCLRETESVQSRISLLIEMVVLPNDCPARRGL